MNAFGDSTLAYIDQGVFLALRALGRGPIVQYVWIYENGADLDGLQRFHRNLQHTLISRLIERSAVPFGRHHWVRYESPGLDVETGERPREQVWDWVDERAFLPLDPEFGPPWHLGVQPLVGGGTAVSLVVSHTTSDAGAAIDSIIDAVNGVGHDFGFPERGARPRWQALRHDIAVSARSVRDIPTAVSAAARTLREQKGSPTTKPAVRNGTPGGDRPVVVPRVYASIDANEWAERARALGGTRNVLFAGLVVRLGYRLGRVDGDGRVMLSVPVSERTEGDTRANPLNGVSVYADPDLVCTDLSAIRADTKSALAELSRTSAQILAPLALTPFTPKLAVRRVEKMVMKEGKPVGCSNVGEIPEAANQPDGSNADFFTMRGGEAGLTPNIMERLGGHLLVSSVTLRDRVWIAVASWEGDRCNTRSNLAEVVEAAFGDFELKAQLDF